MTLMAAEAGEGAVESEAADTRTAGRKATARPRRAPAARAARATPAGRAASAAGAVRQRRAQSSGGARNRRVVRQGAQQGAKTLTGNYHGAVFGEFILAVLLVAGLPFARPNQTGVSPYAGRDMIQLLAVTVTYFLLAILAATGRTQARFAAWFGVLILLGIGLVETPNITTAVKNFLPGATPAATTADTTAGNASTVNPTGESPTGTSRAVAQQPGTGVS